MKVIVHRLVKERNVRGATVQLRSSQLPDDGRMLQVLLSQTRKGINRSSGFAHFDREVDGQPKTFERILTEYVQEDPTDNDVAFFNLSERALHKLKELIEGKVAAIGGYVLIADYIGGKKENPERFILVALIRNQELPSLTDDLELISALVLDLEKLKHGVRVKTSLLGSNDDGVLTVISPKHGKKELAEYFSEFVGSSEFTDSSRTGMLLYERVNQWCDRQNMSSHEASEIHARTFSHWKSQGGADAGLSMQALANELYPEDPDEFYEFLTDEANGLPPMTPSIRAAHMNRFRKYEFSGEGLRLTFDRHGKNSWENRVIKQGSNVVILDAPKKLLDDLESDE